MERKNKYPAVFVHGMFGWGADEGLDKHIPYWGATTGNLMEFLTESGYEAYAMSVGPISSAWDRACEMYAKLMGTKVDYGKVHSEKHNHRRFGRTYEEPLFEGFSNEKKIHLIGHSFGGNTIRLFAYLMTYGSKEEMEGTDENDISGFFTGGKGDWIQSLTSICAPHNGTVAFQVAEKYKLLSVVEAIAFNYVNIAGRLPVQSTLFDFHLEQFGMNNTPGKEDRRAFFQSKRNLKSGTDNIEYDLIPEGAEKFNTLVCKTSPNTYFFSYYFNAIEKNKSGNYSASNTDFPFLYMTSNLIMFNNRKAFESGECDYGDYANDGLVNIASAMHPDNQPFKTYDADNLEKGIWQVMPEKAGDHGTAIGLFADKEKTHDFYLEVMDVLLNTEKVEDKTIC